MVNFKALILLVMALTQTFTDQSRSQKCAMGGCFGGLGAKLLALENFVFFRKK